MNYPGRLLTAIFILSTSFLFADVALVKTAGVVAYEEAKSGFSSVCYENVQSFDLMEDLSNQNEILESLRKGTFQLIFAIGAQAGTLVKANFPDTPLVFCLVFDPEKSGLTGDKVTGVAMGVPIKEQFAVLRSISSKVKKIGTIYTENSGESLVNKAKDAAKGEGMEMILSPLSSSKDIQQAMANLAGKIDALWIPPDPSLVSDEVTKYIGSTSLSRQIPCVGPGDRYVRSGAIFSFSVDPMESGKTAGDIAIRILKGTSPSKISIQTSLKPKVIINLKAAGLLGLTIPRSVQDAASKIYQ